MPTLRDFYLVEARLSYLEQILGALGLINPVVDPGPSDLSRLGAAELLALRRPGGPIVDPAVTDRVRLAELLLRRPPHGDPPASDRVRLEGLDPVLAEWIARLLTGGDPPPEDIARLTASELESTVRAVADDIVRLRSIEGLLNERLKELREGEAGKQ